MAPTRRYLRITRYSVLEVRIYLETPTTPNSTWLLHTRDPALPRIITAIRPLVLPKLREENERVRTGKKKGKGIKDTISGEDFEVSVFLTESGARHALLARGRGLKTEMEGGVEGGRVGKTGGLKEWLDGGAAEKPVDLEGDDDGDVVVRQESDEDDGGVGVFPETNTTAQSSVNSKTTNVTSNSNSNSKKRRRPRSNDDDHNDDHDIQDSTHDNNSPISQDEGFQDHNHTTHHPRPPKPAPAPKTSSSSNPISNSKSKSKSNPQNPIPIDDDDDDDDTAKQTPQDQEEDKKKLTLNTSYDGFSIYGRVLCLIVKRRGGSGGGAGAGAGAGAGSSRSAATSAFASTTTATSSAKGTGLGMGMMMEDWVSTQAEGLLAGGVDVDD